MKLSFIDYIIKKFEKEADKYDKFKLLLYTSFTTSILSVMSTHSIITFFSLNRYSIFSYILLMFMAVFFIRPVKYWYVGFFLADVEDESLNNSSKKTKRETQKPKKG